jgi:hypothetical protein
VSRADLENELRCQFLAGVAAGRLTGIACPSAEMNALADECTRQRIDDATKRGLTLSAYRDDEVAS